MSYFLIDHFRYQYLPLIFTTSNFYKVKSGGGAGEGAKEIDGPKGEVDEVRSIEGEEDGERIEAEEEIEKEAEIEES